MNNKYIKVAAGVIVLLLIVVGLSVIKTKQKDTVPASNSEQEQNTQPTAAPYLFGTVTQIEPGKVYIKTIAFVDANNQLQYKIVTALVSNQTHVVRQVVSQPGNHIKLVDGKLSDIKVGSSIYTPKEGSEAGVYTPEKITIIK